MTETAQQPTQTQPTAVIALGPADVWRIVRKRIWLIIACFVLFGLGGTGGVIAWFYVKPLYTAQGLVQVEPGQRQTGVALTAGYQEQIPTPLFDAYLESQVMAIKNNRVLRNALDALKGKQTMFGGANPSFVLRKKLVVSHIPNSQNIVVQLTGPDGEQLRDIVREVLTQYIEQLEAGQAQTDADRQQELRVERDDLRRQLDDLARGLARYRDESAITVADERGSEQMARLNELVRQLTVTQAALAETSAAWEQFQELRKQAEETGDLSPILMAFPDVTEGLRRDQTVIGLRRQLSMVEQNLQGVQQRFGEQHDQVRRLSVQLQAARNDLEAQQSEILNQLVQQQEAVLQNRYSQARVLEADLQTRVGEARAAAISVAKLTAEYRAREQKYQRVQEMLNTVEDGLERMRINSAISRANIQVVSWPDVPVEPSEPRPILYSFAAILFSLAMGMGLSLLIELMDTRLRTPAQVVRQVGVPVLASVPDLSEDDRLSLQTNLALVSQSVPESLIAEAFRQLRTSLLFASDRPIKSILISSVSPGDGKSTVAANLAITTARSGRRVLLIESNFRRPTLARAFDVPDGVGLSNVLVGLNTASEAIQATAIENLDLLVAGLPPPSPAELLGSPSMRRLVTEMADRYDQILIDGAPMLIVADNHLLVDNVDGVVLVYQADRNTRGMATRAARQVLSLRGQLFGAVLNHVRATKGGYFRESFDAYYDYAGNPRQSAPAAAAAMPAARPIVRDEPPPAGPDDADA